MDDTKSDAVYQRYDIREVENGFIILDRVDDAEYVAADSNMLLDLMRSLTRHYQPQD